jgi:uncharacterized BrkB/YihY/UPF0761 family membrane protein
MKAGKGNQRGHTFSTDENASGFNEQQIGTTMITFLGLLLLISLFLVGSIALHLYLHRHQAIPFSVKGVLQRSHTAQLHDAVFQHI